MPQTPSKSTRRRRTPESFADWMARIDDEVEEMVRTVSRKVPAWEHLNPHQRRICEMVAEFLRSLPALNEGEDPFNKPAYLPVKAIISTLFSVKYPQWTQSKDGLRYIDNLPGNEPAVYRRLLTHCASQRFENLAAERQEEDEDR